MSGCSRSFTRVRGGWHEAALVVDADVLVAEQEDLVFAPGVRDLFRRRIVECLAQIDPDNLRSKHRRQRTNLDGHGVLPA